MKDKLSGWILWAVAVVLLIAGAFIPVSLCSLVALGLVWAIIGGTLPAALLSADPATVRGRAIELLKKALAVLHGSPDTPYRSWAIRLTMVGFLALSGDAGTLVSYLITAIMHRVSSGATSA